MICRIPEREKVSWKIPPFVHLWERHLYLHLRFALRILLDCYRKIDPSRSVSYHSKGDSLKDFCALIRLGIDKNIITLKSNIDFNLPYNDHHAKWDNLSSSFYRHWRPWKGNEVIHYYFNSNWLYNLVTKFYRMV